MHWFSKVLILLGCMKLGVVTLLLRRQGTGKEEKPDITEEIDWLNGENYGAK